MHILVRAARLAELGEELLVGAVALSVQGRTHIVEHAHDPDGLPLLNQVADDFVVEVVTVHPDCLLLDNQSVLDDLSCIMLFKYYKTLFNITKY